MWAVESCERVFKGRVKEAICVKLEHPFLHMMTHFTTLSADPPRQFKNPLIQWLIILTNLTAAQWTNDPHVIPTTQGVHERLEVKYSFESKNRISFLNIRWI